jgi:hypothetical protein
MTAALIILLCVFLVFLAFQQSAVALRAALRLHFTLRPLALKYPAVSNPVALTSSNNETASFSDIANRLLIIQEAAAAREEKKDAAAVARDEKNDAAAVARDEKNDAAAVANRTFILRLFGIGWVMLVVVAYVSYHVAQSAAGAAVQKAIQAKWDEILKPKVMLGAGGRLAAVTYAVKHTIRFFEWVLNEIFSRVLKPKGI